MAHRGEANVLRHIPQDLQVQYCFALASGSKMLNRSNTWQSPHVVVALVIGAVVIVLVSRQANSATAKPANRLSPVELEIVGTWEYSANQFGEEISITLLKDRTCFYTHSESRSGPSVFPAHWRIDGANLIIEQKVVTMLGGPASIPIPDAVRRLRLPKSMWHTDKITQTLSFSDNGNLQLSGFWPAATLTRCETIEKDGQALGHPENNK